MNNGTVMMDNSLKKEDTREDDKDESRMKNEDEVDKNKVEKGGKRVGKVQGMIKRKVGRPRKVVKGSKVKDSKVK